MSSLVVAICNQKAGVGKTTTAIRLGYALLERGRKVLLIDLDPEGSLTMACDIDPAELTLTVYHVLCGKATMAEVLRIEVLYEATGLDVAPANVDLAAAEFELINAIDREKILHNALEPLRRGYDYLLIDCPSSLGLLTISAMVASDYILIPVECEYPAIQGLRVLFRAYEWAKQYNRNLGVLGILPCFYDRQSHHTHEVLEKMQKFYPDWMLEPIRRSPRFVEAPFEWRRMLDYAGKMPEVEAYRRLAEVIDHARGRGR